MHLSSRMEFENGTQIWQEAEIKPFDCRKLQAGMFMDRPDLWQKPKRRPHRIASEQIALITDLISQGIQESSND